MTSRNCGGCGGISVGGHCEHCNIWLCVACELGAHECPRCEECCESFADVEQHEATGFCADCVADLGLDWLRLDDEGRAEVQRYGWRALEMEAAS